MGKKIFIILFFLALNSLNAQIFDFGLDSKDKKQDEIFDGSTIEEEPIDTIYLKEYDLHSVKFKSDLEKKYYLWLRKRVRDVWPYVRTAVIEYNTVMDTVSTMDKKREKKKYIKNQQKILAEKFEKDLKNMTVSRGQIITKLIYKETGKTTFDIVKELRGGISAFLYNAASNAYDINLKETFDPKRTREDLYIAVILQKDFANNVLEPIY